jgi:hypothetical protein
MDKHRKIIGVFFGYMVFYLAMVLSQNSFFSFDFAAKLGTIFGFVISAFYFSAANSMIKNLSWASKLCTPLAVVTLLSFPLGTIIGAYYLWFRFYTNSGRS